MYIKEELESSVGHVDLRNKHQGPERVFEEVDPALLLNEVVEQTLV